jgi:hypothetical protein
MCDLLGFTYMPDVEVNEYGTPQVGPMFHQVQEAAKYDILAYVNSDIILFQDFIEAIQKAQELPAFLMVGRRWNWNNPGEIMFHDGWQKGVIKNAKSNGSLFVPATDYFVFTRGLFDIFIPPLSIGRFYFDPWLMWAALRQGHPLIDATGAVFAVHQKHPIQPMGAESPEARANFQVVELTSHYSKVSTESANWLLDEKGLRKK